MHSFKMLAKVTVLSLIAHSIAYANPRGMCFTQIDGISATVGANEFLPGEIYYNDKLGTPSCSIHNEYNNPSLICQNSTSSPDSDYFFYRTANVCVGAADQVEWVKGNNEQYYCKTIVHPLTSNKSLTAAVKQSDQKNKMLMTKSDVNISGCSQVVSGSSTSIGSAIHEYGDMSKSSTGGWKCKISQNKKSLLCRSLNDNPWNTYVFVDTCTGQLGWVPATGELTDYNFKCK